jgi:hypothetical protein
VIRDLDQSYTTVLEMHAAEETLRSSSMEVALAEAH